MADRCRQAGLSEHSGVFCLIFPLCVYGSLTLTGRLKSIFDHLRGSRDILMASYLLQQRPACRSSCRSASFFFTPLFLARRASVSEHFYAFFQLPHDHFSQSTVHRRPGCLRVLGLHPDLDLPAPARFPSPGKAASFSVYRQQVQSSRGKVSDLCLDQKKRVFENPLYSRPL